MSPNAQSPAAHPTSGAPGAGDVAREIAVALRAAADPARAVPMAAYMRDRFAFLGIPASARRTLTRGPVAAVRRMRDEAAAIAVARALWCEPWRECHYAGVDLLVACAGALTPASLPPLEGLVVTHGWWDTVDVLAKHVVGALLRNHPGAVPTVDRWANASDRWLRRTAILHQLGAKDATDADRLFRYCLANAADPDFFLRKGIGWALREYAYVEPLRVAAFLDEHRDRLSPLTLREAAKHLAPAPTAGRRQGGGSGNRAATRSRPGNGGRG
jgi:3-methyladenine DNA glycosylase AlkD